MSSTISVSEYDALYDGFCRVRAERDAAIARAEAAEAQVAKLREALTELLAVAQQAVDNVIVTCDRMWVSDAELAEMARQAIARSALEPAHD